MRTSNELSTLYKSIDQKNISESAKETLKKIRLANKNFKGKDEDAQELFIEFFNKLKSSKPVAIKTTQEYKDALKKAQVERGRKMREAKGKPKEPKGEGNEVDANRPAKPFGWRMRGKHNYRKPTRDDISKGRAYYEGRVNRADVKRKKYPMLERGGMAEDVYYVNDFYPNYDEDKIAKVLKDNGFKKVRKGRKYGWSNQPEVVIFEGDKNMAKNILEKEFDNYISINEKDWGRKYEDGGYMAEGGEVYYEKKLKDGNTFQVVTRDTSGMRGEQDKYTMLIVDSQGKVVKNYGSHPSLSGAKKFGEKFEDGGYMAEGDETSKKRYVKSSYNSNSLIDDKNNASKYFLHDAEYMLKSYGNAKVEKVDNSLPDGVGMNYIVVIDSYKKYAKGGYMAEGGEVSVYNLRKGDKVKTRNGDIETIVRKTGSGSYETIENDYSHSPESLEFVSRPSRKMAKGGAIENQYEGRYPKDIWDNLSIQQRSHFIYDHADEIEELKGVELKSIEIKNAYNSKWVGLDPWIRNRFENHVREGEYAKGGKLGLNTYKLRAEGLNDFLSFLQTGMYMRMKSFTIEPIGVPEVVVTFVTDASLSEIKSKLREVQDSHVMLETLKPIQEYTGDRDEMMAKGGTIKVGDKVRSTTFKGVEGKVISKKGDMLFIEKYNALPNGDTQRDVLRISEVEKMAKGGEVSVYDLRKGDKVKTRNGDIETIVRKTGSGSYETIENDYTHSPESLEFVSRPSRKMAKGGEVFYTEKHKND